MCSVENILCVFPLRIALIDLKHVREMTKNK